MTLHEFHARRWAMVKQWQAVHRLQPALWRVCNFTKETPNLQLFQEEFARANGRRSPALPILTTQQHNSMAPKVMNALVDNDAAHISARAQHVRYGSSMTQHIVDIGLFRESIPFGKLMMSSQNLYREETARRERVMKPNPPDIPGEDEEMEDLPEED